jgi:hypothetical protein
MHYSDYLGEQAAKSRQLAEPTEDALVNHEFLELAAVCEDVANEIDDRRARDSRNHGATLCICLPNDIRREGHSIHIVS